jgi:fucose permease
VSDDGKPNVRWLTLTAWFAVLVFATCATLCSVPLKDIGADLGLGFALKGSLSPTRAVTLMLTTLLLGWLADRFEKRRFLVGGLLVISFALLWIGRSSGYWGLAAGLAILGVGLGALEALMSPLIAELHPRRVGTQMNVLHGFFPAGMVVVSLVLGTALDRGVHWRVPFTVAAVPTALVALMFMVGRYPSHPRKARPTPLRVRAVLANRTFWLLAAAMALAAGVEGVLSYWSPNFIQHEYGASTLVGAWGLIAFSAAMAAGRFGTGAAAQRVSLHRLMVAFAFLSALATLALAVVAGLRASFVLLALSGVLTACFWPSILTLATTRIASGSAMLLAMISSAGLVGFGAMPWAVGVIAEHFSLRLGLCIVPVAMALAGVLLLKLGNETSQ